MKKILYLSFYTALIMAVFMGCSSSKSVSTSYKPVQAPADKALVYIYRSSSYAALIAMSVDLDNFQTGNFRTKNYYICLLDPGSHQIIAHAENKSELNLQLEGGKTYYIELQPKMGFAIARCNLEINNSESDALKKVAKCKLIGINQPAKQLLGDLPVSK